MAEQKSSLNSCFDEKKKYNFPNTKYPISYLLNSIVVEIIFIIVQLYILISQYAHLFPLSNISPLISGYDEFDNQ